MGSARSEIVYRPIGVIRTPFKDVRGVPIQPTAAEGVRGVVEVYPEYADGLKDLEGFSHVILIYHFHLVRGYRLLVVPYLDSAARGVFATRAPARPNPIGMSVVRLVRVEGNLLHVEDVDIVDGTPLLDIKPYVPQFDCRPQARIGWLAGRIGRLRAARDDGRFVGAASLSGSPQLESRGSRQPEAGQRQG
ncbi:MAG: tRNA (N6-threonylcarbamoyladenosine(37)-N6)-methyltransferase TrmO [Thermoprotei archaeon]|nr:MAG: tRNA (N6-threonylcarbamoyladenosine(37)-N6)-methyltransferase TrmO [Thermoprotei archaeon]